MARSTILCIPKMADCGGFIMGVDNMEPNTPPLVMVKVPPSISSILILPSRALIANLLISDSTPAKSNNSALRTTGTINPLGELTAIEMSA